ncbi:V-type ATP synthase subunit E [Candidatus Woesearchaeota archaeon]|nr:V-type ATP synthase subunit E [Candidatus Woesearchaeota archaeon]
METFGNVEALKSSIEKRYQAEIKNAEKDRDKQLAEIAKELKSRLDILESDMKTATNAEVRKAYSMILSEEKLKAKKEFEEKREWLINAVFREAAKKAKDIVHSSGYVDYIKSSMPDEKGLSVVGDSDYYSKFFPGLKVNDDIVGLRFESENVVYDFTLNNIIASKKDILRHEVSRILFS